MAQVFELDLGLSLSALIGFIWIPDGEPLRGIPEINTYLNLPKSGCLVGSYQKP